MGSVSNWFKRLFKSDADTIAVRIDKMTDAGDIRSLRDGRTIVRNSVSGYGSNSDNVRRAIRLNGNLTSDEIEFVTGLPHQTVSSVLNHLRNRFVTRNTGIFRFTRHGGLAQAQGFRVPGGSE